MSGPDRRSPGAQGPDDQTDPAIPKMSGDPAGHGEPTDPYLPRIGAGTPPAPGTGETDTPEATTGRQVPVGFEVPHALVDGGTPEAAWLVGAGADSIVQDTSGPDLDWIEAPQRSWWRDARVLVPLGALGLLLTLYAVDLLVAGNDVPRNTVVAGMQLGGLTRDQAADVLQVRGVPALAAPRSATAGPVTLEVRPTEAGLRLDVPSTVEAAAAQPLNPLTRVLSLFSDRRVDAVLDIDQRALDAAMTGFAEQVDVEFVEGGIEIVGTAPSVVAPSDGRELDRAGAARALQAVVRAGTGELDFPVREQHTRVSAAEAQQTLESFVVPALSAPVLLTGDDEATTDLTVEEVAALLRFGPADDGSLLAWVDEAGLIAGIGEDAALFVRPPVDATFDVSGASVSVIPSSEGTAIDVASLAEDLTRVLRLAEPREAAVPLTAAAPGLRTNEARALNITAAVSTFTSAYDDASVARNIQIVADAVDGAVIRPGETFSLNATTGPRTANLGYVEAAAPGEGTPAVGEGISPFATAMHNAVFFAGLEPVQRTAHPSYDGSYPAGRDASLRYDATDLVWRDNSPYGVFVQTQWEPTGVTVSFWSTAAYYVEAVSGSQSNLRPPTSEVRTGAECRTSSGSTGFDITVTRVFKQAGTRQVLREEKFSTSYDPMPRVLCEGAPEPPPATEPPPPEVISPPDPSIPSPTSPSPQPPQPSVPTTSRPTTTSPPTTTPSTTTRTTTTTTRTTTTTTTATTTTPPTTTTPTTTTSPTTTSAEPTGEPTTTPPAAARTAATWLLVV